MKIGTIDQYAGPREPYRRKRVRVALPVVVLIAAVALLFGALAFVGQAYATTVTFTAAELLGKPTNNSITVNVVIPASTTIQYYYRYRPDGGTYGGAGSGQSSTVTLTTGGTATPSEVAITGLTADTKYYYQMVYDGDGNVSDDNETGTEHSFHTARPAGSTFKFSVTSDGHAQSTQSAFTNILSELPDFHIDLGDTFMLDSATTQSAVNTAYLAQRAANRLGLAAVSVPIFSTPGNHEQEEGWNLDEAVGVGSIQARKWFLPTPTPADTPFYSANSDPLAAIDDGTYGDDYREDYFSWTWGDALFVVIDTFEYTSQNPYGSVAGEGSNDPTVGDQWNWTLGKTQYDWLTAVLEGSSAKYKFIFSHQMLGGMLASDPGLPSPDYANYVRGGAQGAPYFEWGGYGADKAYAFATQRPGWDKPVRQLFLDTGVSAYFHGHDHQYVYETRDDGMAYVEVPSCGSMTGFSVYGTAGTHYDDVAGGFDVIARSTSSNGGHLLITVGPSQATLELISSGGTVADTRIIAPNVVGPTYDLTMAVSPGGGGTTSPAVGTSARAENSVVNLTATPNPGYIFSSWTGDVANPASATTTVTMDADKTVTANFITQTYTLTMAASPGAGGTTTPTVGGPYTYGANEVVNITATPATGYQFSSWSGGVASPSSASTTVTMTGNKALTANFAVRTYTLTYTAGTGGTISGTTPQTVNHGANGTSVTAVPNANYHFVQWSDGVLTATRQETNVTANKSVTAQFALDTRTLTYTAGTGGTISGTSPQTVNYGANGTSVTAVPNTGYVFVSWSDGVLTATRQDTNVTANISVTANFTAQDYSLTMAVSPGGSGTTTPAAGGPYPYGAGTVVNISATPATGYQFSSWSGGVTSPSSASTTVTMSSNKSLTANFALRTYTITYVAGTGGTISGITPQTVNHGADGTSVTAVPNAGYHFVIWSDGLTSATRQETNVTANLSLTAGFALDAASYTLTYTAGTGGTITGTTPQTVPQGGNGTAVTATPSLGYHFVNWSDGVTTATRQDTNVLANKSVTANFAINTYTLTYTAGANGSVTGVSPQTVPYGTNGTAMTAVPSNGYHFVNWSDGSTANPRTDTTVTANVTVTANFAPDALTYTSIRGSHRYHTAQLVSQAMFAGALPAGAGVVLAPGETYQEALCGAPLAAAYGGPVLLTTTVGLENGTRAELLRLAPTYVFVIGLSNAIATAVQTALPAATVVAINEANVYDMSYKVAKALGSKVGIMTGATAIITIGTNFADAIGVSPLACSELWPILLTDRADNGALHTKAAQALSEMSMTKAIKVGTYATLPGTVAGLANLSGADRYVSNANVANWAKANAGLSFAHTGIATGDKFPDALASGPYLAKDNGILLLSPLAGPLPPAIGALLTANAAAVQHVTFIAMIEPVIGQVKALLP